MLPCSRPVFRCCSCTAYPSSHRSYHPLLPPTPQPQYPSSYHCCHPSYLEVNWLVLALQGAQQASHRVVLGAPLQHGTSAASTGNHKSFRAQLQRLPLFVYSVCGRSQVAICSNSAYTACCLHQLHCSYRKCHAMKCYRTCRTRNQGLPHIQVDSTQARASATFGVVSDYLRCSEMSWSDAVLASPQVHHTPIIHSKSTAGSPEVIHRAIL